MKYKYSETAGYYGTGAWLVISTTGAFGDTVEKVFDTEYECISYINKRGFQT